MDKEILVYIENEKNEICDFSYDLISYAKEISPPELKISGVLIKNKDFYEDYENLRKYGLDKLYLIENDAPYFDKTNEADYIFELIKKINPEIFLLNSTSNGREIAPLVASKLKTGLTADCTKLEIIKKENFCLLSTRPTFGGKLLAEIVSKKNPQMSTVRTNTFKKKIFNDNSCLEIENYKIELNCANSVKILDFIEDKKGFFDITNAKIVVSGGLGLKDVEGFQKLNEFANLIGAKVGATRKAVDKGFAEKSCQIGQTGSVVSPLIYIAFGISGAIHHIAGMENSKIIIAVNSDKNAPIFNFADFKIVDDAKKVLEDLICIFKK